MEEQNSWKGHTFTLMIFGGIVVLCSIFFVLGMLVGRTQGIKAASVDAEAAAQVEAPEAAGSLPEIRTYEPDKNRPAIQDSVDAKPEPEPAPKVSAPATPPATARANVVFQISALRKSSEAEKQVNTLKKQGFRAFILGPGPGDANLLYRVQVGPLSDPVEIESTKRKLESAGYKPILKR